MRHTLTSVVTLALGMMITSLGCTGVSDTDDTGESSSPVDKADEATTFRSVSSPLVQGVYNYKDDGLDIHNGSLHVPLMWPNSGPYMGVIVMHGGSWVTGTYGDMGSIADHIAQANNVVVYNINYQLAPNNCAFGSYSCSESGKTKYNAQLKDAQAAVRFMRNNSGFLNLRSDKRIISAGLSAGGQLAALLAFTDAPVNGTSSKTQGIVTFWGPWDIRNSGDQNADGVSPLSPDLGTSMLQARYNYLPGYSSAAPASPYTYINDSAPPACIFHGLQDAVVFNQWSRRAAQKYANNGRKYFLKTFTGGHDWPGDSVIYPTLDGSCMSYFKSM